MSLKHNEIEAFLGLVLKKNPIVNISIGFDTLEIQHFDGTSNELKLENSYPTYFPIDADQSSIDYDALIEYNEPQTVEIDYKPFINELREKVDEYITHHNNLVIPSFDDIQSVVSTSKQSILEQIEEMIASRPIIQQIEEKFDHSLFEINLRSNIDQQITELEQSFKNGIDLLSEQYLQLKETIPTQINEETIISSILNELKEELLEPTTAISRRIDELEEQIAKPPEVKNIYETKTIDVSADKLTKIDHKLQELSTDFSTKHSLLEKAVEIKVDDLLSRIEGSKQKYIASFEVDQDKLIVKYTDSTTEDVTNYILPFLKIHIAALTPRRVSGSIFSSGYGKGDPGYSAYQIAVINGFVGTEVEWLASLSGGYTPPQDGTINRDVNGDIESIVVGTTTTTFTRNGLGQITAVVKDAYTKTFTRDIDGNITGWIIS